MPAGGQKLSHHAAAAPVLAGDGGDGGDIAHAVEQQHRDAGRGAFLCQAGGERGGGQHDRIPAVAQQPVRNSVGRFVLTGNEFLFAPILTREDAVILPVGITRFRTERGDLWELIAAAGILISIPMFLLSSVIQRHFVRGMTGGAVK
jgi:hypothetical protein